ncbi:hypothetical protein STRDD04_01961 [Streptococcus sp. DD04]|nr:hypothetical protein STRDD04_01961 [Streptococcus sp. DD04]
MKKTQELEIEKQLIEDCMYIFYQYLFMNFFIYKDIYVIL